MGRAQEVCLPGAGKAMSATNWPRPISSGGSSSRGSAANDARVIARHCDYDLPSPASERRKERLCREKNSGGTPPARRVRSLFRGSLRPAPPLAASAGRWQRDMSRPLVS